MLCVYILDALCSAGGRGRDKIWGSPHCWTSENHQRLWFFMTFIIVGYLGLCLLLTVCLRVMHCVCRPLLAREASMPWGACWLDYCIAVVLAFPVPAWTIIMAKISHLEHKCWLIDANLCWSGLQLARTVLNAGTGIAQTWHTRECLILCKTCVWWVHVWSFCFTVNRLSRRPAGKKRTCFADGCWCKVVLWANCSSQANVYRRPDPDSEWNSTASMHDTTCSS